ncbi:MAG: HlyD family efflux transporter periplasmic adaptor subunit [Lachnospiraceae bacterium]|nr:HlyD family efflux transporter periplasmic adaptor subunit [Lachnospiraceae bacterium]
MTRKKKLIAGTVMAFCLFLVFGGAGYHFLTAKQSEKPSPYMEAQVEHGDLNLTFTGEGTTANGEIIQELNIDSSAIELVVEEVYAASGDEVQESANLYKITEESLATAKTYYETLVADAEEEVERAKSEYEAGKAQAEYDKQVAQTNANNAQAVYDANNSSLDQKATEAQATLDNAKNQISTYQSNLDNNTYYSDAGVAAKQDALNSAEKKEQSAKKAYEKAKKSYEEALTNISTGISELNQTVADAGTIENAATAVSEKLGKLTENNQTLTEKKTALDEAEKNYQKAQETKAKVQSEYQSATMTYEKSVSEATARKETLESSLNSLEWACTAAQNAATTGKVSNQNTYDMAVLEGEYADTVYASALASYQENLDAATEALEEAKEQQAILLALRDGMVTAEYAGELSGVFYEAGDTIDASVPLVSYCDTNTLTIETEVAQEDISKIAVGDSVQVMLTGVRGSMPEGKITYIAASATAGRSMSNVTYTVKVCIDNSEGAIAANTSAYVIFHYGTVEDVNYILSDAISNADGSQGKIRKYNEAGEIEEISVTLGETTERYTVITEGVTEGDVCLIEMGGAQDNGEEE